MPPVNFTPSMARPSKSIEAPKAKQKRGRPAKKRKAINKLKRTKLQFA